MKKVSIVVPVYNAKKYVGRCIESIINQTYSDLEILLINDGSTDYSLDILKEYKKKDSRIVITDNENSGVSYTRNCGIKSATGEYIMFIDADDTIKKTTIEDNVRLIEEHNADMVIAGFTYYLTERAEVKENPMVKFVGSSREFVEKHFKTALEREVLNPPWNKLIRLSLLKENNIYFNEKYSICEDMAFSMELLRESNKVVMTDKVYYNYFVKSTGSLVFKFNENYFEALSYYYEQAVKALKKHSMHTDSKDNDKIRTVDENRIAVDTLFTNLSVMFIKLISTNRNLDRKKKKSMIKNIGGDKRLKKALVNASLSGKKKFMVFFIKHKLYSIILLLYKIY